MSTVKANHADKVGNIHYLKETLKHTTILSLLNVELQRSSGTLQLDILSWLACKEAWFDRPLKDLFLPQKYIETDHNFHVIALYHTKWARLQTCCVLEAKPDS